MHPLEARLELLKCNLNYESLTVPELQQRVQKCLEQATSRDPNAWLEVVNWFQESMRPARVKTSRATLDVLETTRPVIVCSSFGHTVLANTRSLELAKITASTRDPIGGKIWRDAAGQPTGLLEEAAFAVFSTLLPKPTAADNMAGATAALQAMNRQGVTSFLDAVAPEEDIAAFAALRQSSRLTARAHFAPPIQPSEASDPAHALARVIALSEAAAVLLDRSLRLSEHETALEVGWLLAESCGVATTAANVVNRGQGERRDSVNRLQRFGATPCGLTDRQFVIGRSLVQRGTFVPAKPVVRRHGGGVQRPQPATSFSQPGIARRHIVVTECRHRMKRDTMRRIAGVEN
jgi:Amidohydrolase family